MNLERQTFRKLHTWNATIALFVRITIAKQRKEKHFTTYIDYYIPLGLDQRVLQTNSIRLQMIVDLSFFSQFIKIYDKYNLLFVFKH